MAAEEIRIRAARPEDASELARMLNALGVHEGFGDGIYSTESVRTQIFGSRPALDVLVVEGESGLIGYAAYERTFNTDCGEPGLWLHDIYLEARARGCGLGRRLMAEVARMAVAEGRTSVWWGVHNRNAGALAFYAALGARDDDARILELDGASLRDLANTAGD